jgi:hypothetical protein
MASGEMLRFDFVQTVVEGKGKASDSFSGGHRNVNGVSVTLTSQGGQSGESYDASFRAIDDTTDDSSTFVRTIDSIQRVIIVLANGDQLVAQREGTANSVTLAGGVVVTFEESGEVTIEDLPQDSSVAVYTNDGFTALEVKNSGAGEGIDEFLINNVGAVQSTGATDPVSLSFDLLLSNGPNNDLLVENAVNVTVGANVIDGDAALLLPTDGYDVFEWNLADPNSADTIENVDPNDPSNSETFDENQDAIDLGDLLSGYEDGDDLSTFINVTASNGDTVIKVSSVGDLDANGNGTVDQVITVKGVDLTNLDLNADNAIDADDMTILIERLRTGSIIDPDSGG